MNAVVTVSETGRGLPEMGAKRRLTTWEEVPGSDLPFRLFKRRTGVCLGSFVSQEALDEFLSGYSLESLQVAPTRRRVRGW